MCICKKKCSKKKSRLLGNSGLLEKHELVVNNGFVEKSGLVGKSGLVERNAFFGKIGFVENLYKFEKRWMKFAKKNTFVHIFLAKLLGNMQYFWSISFKNSCFS